MIQSYLKTGMVFYGGGSTAISGYDQQHFRQTCCKEVFYQFTDENHFPSFQFFIPFAIRIPLELWQVRLIRWDGGDDATTIGDFGALDFPVNVYHNDSGTWITHDYRDAVVYPVGYNNEDAYFLQIRLRDARGAGGNVYWNSEIFKVCDCEVEGVGDGLNLIENGWMEDWAGLANPNNYPLGWTLVGNDATNYVADAGGECQMISDNTQALEIRQNILTVGKWYVWTINITDDTDPGVALRNGAIILETYNTVGSKNIVFQATDTLIGIRRSGVMDMTFTDVRIEEFVGFKFCDMITLNWWSDCDWDSIIYQYGFRNSLVLDSNLQTPAEDIVINPDERLGEMFVRDVVIKKRYKFNIRIPEYLWNALIRLAAYGSEMPNFHCWITLPDGSFCKMSEVAVLGDWDVGNCMNTLTIEFVDNDEYPVVAGNCCKDKDISEV